MRKIKSSELSLINSLFDDSIYCNNHLGWLNYSELPEESGALYLDSFCEKDYFIAIQKIQSGVFWLHSFFSNSLPEKYPLAKKLKEIIPSGYQSIFSISSHSWFNSLLKENDFRECDEIVEMETEHIHLPSHYSQKNITQLSISMTDDILFLCESSFAPLWRLDRTELIMAIQNSSYCKVVQENNVIFGYILADFTSDNCHIQRIAVRNDHQNEGIASAMVRQMIIDSHNQGISNFSVNTNHNNAAAMNFYNSMNFRIIGKRFPVFFRYLYAKGELS